MLKELHPFAADPMCFGCGHHRVRVDMRGAVHDVPPTLQHCKTHDTRVSRVDAVRADPCDSGHRRACGLCGSCLRRELNGPTACMHSDEDRENRRTTGLQLLVAARRASVRNDRPRRNTWLACADHCRCPPCHDAWA